MKPNSVVKLSRPAAFAPANVGLRKSDRSTTGSRCRCSSTMKAASARIPSAKAPRISAEAQAMAVTLDQTVRDPVPGQPTRDQPGYVESLLGTRVTGVTHEDECGCDAEHAERKVDVEDPRPREGVDEEAADERPNRECAAGDAGPDPDRRPSFLGRERRRDDGERCGQHQSSSDALGDSPDNQHFAARRQRTQERTEREDHEAGHEILRRPRKSASLPPLAAALRTSACTRSRSTRAAKG